MGPGSLVAQSLKNDIKLIRVRRRHRLARTIQSHSVHPHAHLGIGVDIGIGAVVNAGTSIGNHSYLNRGAMLLSGSIGRYSSIGYNACIGGEAHPVTHVSTSPRMYGANSMSGSNSQWDEYSRPPQVGNDVWVGANAVISQNVKIGDGAIVGAGSVVTRSVEPFTVVAGSPARVIRARFSEAQKEVVARTPWWEASEKDIRSMAGVIDSGPDWLDAYRTWAAKLA